MTDVRGTYEERSGARRGRKPVRPDPESGSVALLAHRLWDLKQRAGDPSFSEMSSRLGAAASKSSLAAAARGRTLPSWETTWEFVRVLAVDRLGQDAAEAEREWREHWERARNDDQSLAAGGSGPTAETWRERWEPREPAEDALRETAATSGPAPERRFPRDRKQVLPILLTAMVAGGVSALVALILSFVGRDAENEPAPSTTWLRTAGPLGDATAPRDDSAFEGDVTHPDGTVVRSGTRFTKIWRIRNTGTVPWHGRHLRRINNTPCRAPERVPIRPTAPGEAVDIAVEVRAADVAGRCKIYWKMIDESGTRPFAGKDPIFLDVTVK